MSRVNWIVSVLVCLYVASSVCHALTVPPLCPDMDASCRCAEEKHANVARVVITCHDTGARENVPRVTSPREADADVFRVTGNSSIALVQSEAFAETGLRFLHLNNLGIQSLHAQAFTNMSRAPAGGVNDIEPLQELVLSHNDIQELPFNIFRRTANLRLLDFSRNHLETLNFDLLSTTTQLELLNLSQNRLTNLHELFLTSLTKLQDLNLSQNSITAIDLDWFGNIINLRHLDISYNKIRRLHEFMFHSLTKLERLDISHNEILEIPEKLLLNNIRLIDVNLAGNNVTRILANTFHGCPALQRLDMSANPD